MILQHSDQTYTVQAEAQPDGHFLVTIGENTLRVQVRALPDGGLLLDWGAGQVMAYTAAEGDQRYVQVMGQALTFTVPRNTRRRAAAGSGDLTAQMPGQVVEVMVQAGDAVESGQTLLILEAMKMEIRVTAPAAGMVKAVMVTRGQVVERGQHLIEFAPTV
ncbi:MAG: acetyl-CoA carboxylase biotin carboxyl carrier protein subunit [Anaerolineae bacterium]